MSFQTTIKIGDLVVCKKSSIIPKVFFTNQEDFFKKVYEGQVIVIVGILSPFEKVELYTGILKNEIVYVPPNIIKRVMLYDEVR